MDNPPNPTLGATDASQSSTNGHMSQAPSQPPSVASSTPFADDPISSTHSSASNSGVSSPVGSREPSPIRPHRPSAPFTRGRQPKNSAGETSPSRQSGPGASNPHGPSKSLSRTNAPVLPPNTRDSSRRSMAPQKQQQGRDSSLRWPISPRLRSPPPQLNRLSSQSQSRRSDQSPVNTRVPAQSPSPPDTAPLSESETEDIQLQSGLRTPAPGSMLETVQEVSLPSSPGVVTHEAMEQVKEKLKSELVSEDEGGYVNDAKTLRARSGLYNAESGSENGSLTTEPKKPSAPTMSRQSSSISTAGTKTKPEGTTQNMTVETETVVSVPNVVLAPVGQQGGGSTLKRRPSTETIKPKREKKRTGRKQATVPAGAGEALIFLPRIS
jgi:hypothetical protein